MKLAYFPVQLGFVYMSEMMAKVDERTQLVGHNRLELLLFFLGDEQCFGINVFKVREVIDCPSLTKTPDSHQFVSGIAHIRGQTISIIDLGAMIGKPAIDLNRRPRVIVAEYNRAVQGFLVSDVARIVNLNWESVKPPPSGVGAQSFLTAVTYVDGRIVEILDVEKVLGEVNGSSDKLSTQTLRLSRDTRRNAEHVLIVDDSSMARKQMSRVMRQLQVPFTVVTNGREAYDLLQRWVNGDKPAHDHEHCGLVVSDVEMPEMDGYTLTKKIKDNPEMRNIHVLLHSSLSGTFNASMVRKVGADDFLAKYDPDELARRILGYLNSHHA